MAGGANVLERYIGFMNMNMASQLPYMSTVYTFSLPVQIQFHLSTQCVIVLPNSDYCSLPQCTHAYYAALLQLRTMYVCNCLNETRANLSYPEVT